MVWNNDHVPYPVLPSPRGYGWTLENDEWIPVTATLSPATEAIIQLLKCKCAKERCSTNRCQCRKAGLPSTDLCSCSEDDDKSENQPGECDDDDDDSDIEDQEDDADKFDKRLQKH